MQLVEFGASPRFERRELPDPEPTTGEVVVGVVTAGLNRRDPWIWQTPDYCRLPGHARLRPGRDGGRGGLRVLRPGGRLATCGAHGGELAPVDVIELFRSELSLIGSCACTPSELRTIVELVGAGRLNPVVDSVFPLVEVKAAHQRMEGRTHFGKIILSTA